jgi:asparagine synthase (glutamine-hydrolysing)
MQAQSGRRIRTFSIGFTEPAFDEAPDARAVALHLGTEHTELYASPADALAVIPSLPRIYDEPFADSSQIPTWLVSRLARTGVTVSLSGDGGDETFGGYQRYALTRRMWSVLRWVPGRARAALGEAARVLAGAPLPRIAAKRAHRLATILPAASLDAMYLEMVFPHWQVPGRGVGSAGAEPLPLAGAIAEIHGGTPLERLMLWDLLAYLPDDILVKVDRASMNVSLESRMPLLDHRLVEFALALPERMKQRRGVGKWLLRRVLDRYVPAALVDRPKRGFHVPLDDWLRGPLAGWARDLLSPALVARQGYLDPRAVGTALREHLAGARSWGANLWVACMFQAWLADQAARPARADPRPAAPAGARDAAPATAV